MGPVERRGKQSRRLSREREQNTAVTGVSKEVQERGWFSDGMVECSGGQSEWSDVRRGG